MPESPVCRIIAGPNGAGKTTFALDYLPSLARRTNFVNADLIAAGLSPLAPERELLEAGRIFLREIQRYIGERENFAFETTLSGRSYLRLVEGLISEGWEVELYYLWLPSVQMSIDRVAERVRSGGHNIALKDIRRRYPRGLRNLVHRFAPVCTYTACLDNALRKPDLIFVEDASGRSIHNARKYQRLLEAIGNE